MLMSVEEISRALQARNVKEVERDAGVHFVTLYRIRGGKLKTPSYSTLEKLTNYIRAYPTEAESLERENAELRERLGE